MYVNKMSFYLERIWKFLLSITTIFLVNCLKKKKKKVWIQLHVLLTINTVCRIITSTVLHIHTSSRKINNLLMKYLQEMMETVVLLKLVLFALSSVSATEWQFTSDMLRQNLVHAHFNKGFSGRDKSALGHDKLVQSSMNQMCLILKKELKSCILWFMG